MRIRRGAGEDAGELVFKMRHHQLEQRILFFHFFTDDDGVEQFAVVKIIGDLVPAFKMVRTFFLVVRKSFRRAFQHGLGQHHSALHPDEQAAGENRVNEARRIADERPVLAEHPVGDELVVGVFHHGRDALGIAGKFVQDGILFQKIVVTIFLRCAKLRQMLGSDDDAEGHAVGQRNAPAPAVVKARAVDMAVVIHLGLVNVREERGVLASALDRADTEQFRQQTDTARGVHDEVGLGGAGRAGGRRSAVEKIPGGGERVVAEFDFVRAGNFFHGRGGLDDFHAGLPRGGEERVVELVAWNVVGVFRQLAPDVVELERKIRVRAHVDRRAGLELGIGFHLILHAERAKHGNDGGHE